MGLIVVGVCAAAINFVLGALGGLLMRFTDRLGAIAITPMPIVTFVLALIAGLSALSHDLFRATAAVIGGLLIGGHFGMHSICGIFYPSAYRANAAGWATSVAKIGSIMGPLVGGWVLAGAPARPKPRYARRFFDRPGIVPEAAKQRSHI
jgi:AAHS family 4-hydroxybenzoate transporter-like MFS transporter